MTTRIDFQKRKKMYLYLCLCLLTCLLEYLYRGIWVDKVEKESMTGVLDQYRIHCYYTFCNLREKREVME